MVKIVTPKPQGEIIKDETQIIFTTRSFVALISVIFGVMLGFYTLVIAPKINNIEDTNAKLTEQITNLNITLAKLQVTLENNK